MNVPNGGLTYCATVPVLSHCFESSQSVVLWNVISWDVWYFSYYYIGSTIFPTASKRFVRSLILSFIHLKGWVTEYFPFTGSLLKWSQQPGLSQWKPEARNSVLISQVGSRDPSIWSSAAAFPDALGGSSVGIGASRIPTSTNKEKRFDDQIMVII